MGWAYMNAFPSTFARWTLDSSKSTIGPGVIPLCDAGCGTLPDACHEDNSAVACYHSRARCTLAYGGAHMAGLRLAKPARGQWP